MNISELYTVMVARCESTARQTGHTLDVWYPVSEHRRAAPDDPPADAPPAVRPRLLRLGPPLPRHRLPREPAVRLGAGRRQPARAAHRARRGPLARHPAAPPAAALLLSAP